MADVDVYTAEVIADTDLSSLSETKSTTTTDTSSTSEASSKSSETTKDTSFPTKKIATELISTVLNTRSQTIMGEFEFTQQGAIKIGKYVNGVSGEINISPNGIVAKDSSGNITFVLYGDKGGAAFSGTLQAGTVIGGAVAVGDGSILIDGETKRMIFYDDDGIPSIIIGNP
jgi:heat shock protein HslJ